MANANVATITAARRRIVLLVDVISILTAGAISEILWPFGGPEASSCLDSKFKKFERCGELREAPVPWWARMPAATGWRQSFVPDVEDGIPAARNHEGRFTPRENFNAFRLALGSFRRAGKPGSTAGKDARRYYSPLSMW
jgi:hypothetical protein